VPHRPSVADRLPELVDAAVRVFAAKGYGAAQMADVAAAMGLGAGSLYNYVESKEGLFALCLERLMHEGSPRDVALPVAAPPLDVTLARLRGRAEQSLRLPALTAAELGQPAAAGEELRAVVTELYELISRTRLVTDMIERSARDLPVLASLFHDEWRTPLFTRLEAYLGSCMDRGRLRRVGDRRVAARFVVETVTWFARHRFHDADGWELDDAATQETVVNLVTGAFLPGVDQEPSGAR
jgi:AcrR family transcriptional regulator